MSVQNVSSMGVDVNRLTTRRLSAGVRPFAHARAGPCSLNKALTPAKRYEGRSSPNLHRKRRLRYEQVQSRKYGVYLRFSMYWTQCRKHA